MYIFLYLEEKKKTKIDYEYNQVYIGTIVQIHGLVNMS